MSNLETLPIKDQRRQSANSNPTQQTVRVAVLPPRLPPDMAAPTGIGASDCFDWDERVNWVHNEPIDQGQAEPSRRKSFMRTIGLTSQRKKRHDEMPPFIMREVPYDTWRKHYAKDADGNYRGTLAPAEDCLLKPEDVAKWSADGPKTKGDKWTRGAAALPVYNQDEMVDAAPAYSAAPNPGSAPEITLNGSEPLYSPPAQTPSTFTADGKTAQQIIEEAKVRAAQQQSSRRGLKNALTNGVNMTMGS